MAWLKVITDPLGIAAFALALIFGVATRALRRRQPKQLRWLAPVAAGLAALCVAGGLFLAYQRLAVVKGKAAENSPELPSRSRAVESPRGNEVHVDHVDQRLTNGAAVAGVGGDVTVNTSVSQPEVEVQSTSKPQISSKPQPNNP